MVENVGDDICLLHAIPFDIGDEPPQIMTSTGLLEPISHNYRETYLYTYGVV